MMSEEEKIALFESYLMGELSGDELEDFESRLDQSPAFKASFKSHKALVESIEDGVEYGNIRTQLEDIHQKEVGKTKVINFKKPLILTLSIAASVAFILLIIDPFNHNSNQDSATAEYQELDNGESYAEEGSEDDVATESVADTENATDTIQYKDSANLNQDILEFIPRDPKGTAFLISENGYFLTSKHLVEKRHLVKLQQKDLGLTFKAKVIYTDSLMDFAVLQCNEEIAANFERIPFKFGKKNPRIGDEVFTLGYPKKEIAYTTGDVSSETGYKSDTLYYEISLPSNPGYSGAPLFSTSGYLAGIITANHSKKQSVTYVLRPDYILNCMDSLNLDLDPKIDMKRNYYKNYSQRSDRVDKYRPYVFEVH